MQALRWSLLLNLRCFFPEHHTRAEIKKGAAWSYDIADVAACKTLARDSFFIFPTSFKKKLVKDFFIQFHCGIFFSLNSIVGFFFSFNFIVGFFFFTQFNCGIFFSFFLFVGYPTINCGILEVCAETDFKRKTRVLRLKFWGKCFKTYRTWLYRFRTRQYKSFLNPRLKKHQKVNSNINSPVFCEKTFFERTWASMNF